MTRFFDWFNKLYPVWLVGLSVVAFLRPETMLWFDRPWIFWSLAASMLGMGLTLNPADFRRVGRIPGAVALGFGAQYTLMPLCGWLVGALLRLEPGLTVGILLVASCPGGMASNLIAYLARANLALSVVLTLCSTMLAFFFTPLWTSLLAGKYVPVDAWGLCLSALQLTVAPVALGVFVRWKLPRVADRVGACGPTVAALAFVLVTGGIVAASADAIAAHFGRLLLAAFTLHVTGFAVGYAMARLLRYPETVARTVSIEVGMQNGGMAAALARQHFPLMPLAAAAGVFSGVMQNIMGSLLAAWWQSRPPVGYHPRRSIYYWKCDRPAAFHGTGENFRGHASETQLADVLREHFPGKPVRLRPAAGQGNHITWLATVDGAELFVRIEDGPERDDYLEVESHVMKEVHALGVPAPRVHRVDAGRRGVPFAWQLLENIPHPDLNQLHKQGRLDMAPAAGAIGAAVARWQAIQPAGFGPFDPEILRNENRLEGFHRRYEEYFFLHLDRHLRFLAEHVFLSRQEAGEMKSEIERHRGLLALEQGCLVHKDLALWNILGSEKEIAAFIDWDDAISGDPMDDLSLLGCFHDAAFLRRAFDGYRDVRPLPSDHRRRFWLHLLRNMIVKSVIRVGAGYFERTGGFFLIGAGATGAELKAFTHQRLAAALNGLRNDSEIETLCM